MSFFFGQLSQEPSQSTEKYIKADLASSPGLPSETGGLEMMFSEIPSNIDVLQVYEYLRFVKLTWGLLCT